ncbi:hypothetical protein KIPB_004299, partial [Kipferlia bialata]
YYDDPVCVSGDRLLIFTNQEEYGCRGSSGTVVSFHLRDGWKVEGTLPTEYKRLRKILVSGSTVICSIQFVPQRPRERHTRAIRRPTRETVERRLVAFEVVSGTWTQLGSTDTDIVLACQIEGNHHLMQFAPVQSSETRVPQSGPIMGSVCEDTLLRLMYPLPLSL